MCLYYEHMVEGTQSLDRSLMLLDAIIADDGQTSASIIGHSLGIAGSSARRIISALEENGLVLRVAHGRYAGGPRIGRWAAHAHPHRRLIETARPLLRGLARRQGWAAHLGVFENDMVTYLVKEGGSSLFTREGAELEAYCTGIGKALLAQMPHDRLTRYLASSFVPLTAKTIYQPNMLEAEAVLIRQRGFAIDDREMSDTVSCVAVPISMQNGSLAAISLSGDAQTFPLHAANGIALRLGDIAKKITKRLDALDRRDRAFGLQPSLQR